jgi:hypothetical protein
VWRNWLLITLNDYVRIVEKLIKLSLWLEKMIPKSNIEVYPVL